MKIYLTFNFIQFFNFNYISRHLIRLNLIIIQLPKEEDID